MQQFPNKAPKPSSAQPDLLPYRKNLKQEWSRNHFLALRPYVLPSQDENAGNPISHTQECSSMEKS